MGSDEGSGEVSTQSRRPSSDPCFARATFSHEWEKGFRARHKSSITLRTRPITVGGESR